MEFPAARDVPDAERFLSAPRDAATGREHRDRARRRDHGGNAIERGPGAEGAANLGVSLVTEPARPLAGMKTMLFFRLEPADGLEPYLGAWGHMLAASEDLVDMIHDHPFLAEGGPQIQFNLIFPRPWLPSVGAVSTRGDGEYGAVRCAGGGVEVGGSREGAGGSL